MLDIFKPRVQITLTDGKERTITIEGFERNAGGWEGYPTVDGQRAGTLTIYPKGLWHVVS